MKKLTLALILAGMITGAHAQESTFNEGDFVINAGLGIGTTLYRGVGYSGVLPPLSISGEYGFKEDFITDGLTLGLGGYLGYASSKYETRFGPETWGWRYNYLVIGARGAVHYPLVDKLDTYGGLMLNYTVVSYNSIGTAPIETSPASGGIGLSIYVGGRYYFSEQFAAMAELGYGIAYLNLGVAYKF